jgi:S1-C subfamily serine protease
MDGGLTEQRLTDTPTPTLTSTQLPTVAAVPTAIPSPIPIIPATTPIVPTPTFSPTAIPTIEDDLLETVGPSTVMVASYKGTGSGVLIDGNYVVTAAHVIWPMTHADVFFTDDRIISARVLGWDLLADIAVIGPVDTELSHFDMSDLADAKVGDAVYSVVHPSSDGVPLRSGTGAQVVKVSAGTILDNPQDGLTGIHSIATSVQAEPGHSGGVVTNESGQFVGVLIAFGVYDDTLHLVPANEVIDRVDRILRGEPSPELGRRNLPTDNGAFEHDFFLSHKLDEITYMFRLPRSSTADIEVVDREDVLFRIINASGEVLTEDLTSIQRFKSTQVSEPYFIVVDWNFLATGAGTIRSTVELIPVVDPDDYRVVDIGDKVFGSLDIPGEGDVFTINLVQGQRIEIRAGFIVFGPVIMIYPPTGAPYDGAWSVDPVTEEFGNGPLIYEAPVDGIYRIIVFNGLWYGSGYALTVSQPSESAIAVKPDRLEEE